MSDGCDSAITSDCCPDVPATFIDSCYRSCGYITLLIDDVPHHWDAARDGWVGPDGSVFPAATLLSLVGAPVRGAP